MADYRTPVAGLPSAEGPATLAAVKADQGITDTRDDVQLQAVVDAVNAVVRSWPCVKVASGASNWDAPEAAAVVRGSVMLCARLWRRKDSPAGVEGFGANGAVYVQRNDPDIALMLSLGPYAPPMVG